MTLRTLAAVALTLTLSACGESAADQALSRMHDAIVKRMTANLNIAVAPAAARSTTNIHVVTKGPIRSVPVANMDFGILSNADLTVMADISSDVRNPRIPLVDASVSLTALLDAPAGTFTGTQPKNLKTAPHETATADVLLSGRSVDRTLLLKISGVSAEAPMLAHPFELPAELSTRWYGIAFDALDKTLATEAKQSGSPPPPPIDQILANAFRDRVSPEALLKLSNAVHVWKGIELLPSENGLVRIRVESDKQKVQDGVRAFLQYVQEASGPSWQTQLKNNPALQRQIDALQGDDPEFMKTMGTVKGVLSADAGSYEFMGFDGDISDASGSVKGRVTVTRTKDGDAGLSITDTASKDTVTFAKKGDKVTGTFDGKTTLEGTVSASHVDLTALDPKTGKATLAVVFDFRKLSAHAFTITSGTITVPSEKAVIHLKELSASLTDSRVLTCKVDASLDLAGTQLITIVADTKREPISALKVEKPAFQPMENLYQDLLHGLIGSADAGGAPGSPLKK